MVWRGGERDCRDLWNEVISAIPLFAFFSRSSKFVGDRCASHQLLLKHRTSRHVVANGAIFGLGVQSPAGLAAPASRIDPRAGVATLSCMRCSVCSQHELYVHTIARATDFPREKKNQYTNWQHRHGSHVIRVQTINTCQKVIQPIKMVSSSKVRTNIQGQEDIINLAESIYSLIRRGEMKPCKVIERVAEIMKISTATLLSTAAGCARSQPTRPSLDKTHLALLTSQERRARGLLPVATFWESRVCRQRRDLPASQTSSYLLEFPLATTQECSGETGWRLSPPRRITRVGEDSRWRPKTLYILPQPSSRQSLTEAARPSVPERSACGRRRVRCSRPEWTRGCETDEKLNTLSAYTRQKAKLKYRNRIRLERASQKQSSDSHKTPYDRVKRCRERKINIKASERVNVDVFTRNKRPYWKCRAIWQLSVRGARQGAPIRGVHPLGEDWPLECGRAANAIWCTSGMKKLEERVDGNYISFHLDNWRETLACNLIGACTPLSSFANTASGWVTYPPAGRPAIRREYFPTRSSQSDNRVPPPHRHSTNGRSLLAGGGRRSPRKPADQWHRPARFPPVVIRGRPVHFQCVSTGVSLQWFVHGEVGKPAAVVKAVLVRPVRLLAFHQEEPDSISSRFTPDFPKWDGTMPLVSGFSRGSPVSHALAFWRCSMLSNFHPRQLSRPRSTSLTCRGGDIADDVRENSQSGAEKTATQEQESGADSAAPRRNRRPNSPSPLTGTMRSRPPDFPLWGSRERLLEFPIRLATTQECSGNPAALSSCVNTLDDVRRAVAHAHTCPAAYFAHDFNVKNQENLTQCRPILIKKPSRNTEIVYVWKAHLKSKPSDTNKTSYDRVKRCRERKINIKAPERVNVDVFTQNKRPCPQHSHPPPPAHLRNQMVMVACCSRKKNIEWSVCQHFWKAVATVFERLHSNGPDRLRSVRLGNNSRPPTMTCLYRHSSWRRARLQENGNTQPPHTRGHTLIGPSPLAPPVELDNTLWTPRKPSATECKNEMDARPTMHGYVRGRTRKRKRKTWDGFEPFYNTKKRTALQLIKNTQLLQITDIEHGVWYVIRFVTRIRGRVSVDRAKHCATCDPLASDGLFLTEDPQISVHVCAFCKKRRPCEVISYVKFQIARVKGLELNEELTEELGVDQSQHRISSSIEELTEEVVPIAEQVA
ncbi:hypothetical protein PR048_032607 [Dryococelus australis]|uniref:Uncharacterized protein n=1 Tax=Dryococelus australis TaxID=614101 RepID=A0ABQ9G6V5_9NEOP|nr:hypothetical protein PR048_032607 [Dryococelus australis]